MRSTPAEVDAFEVLRRRHVDAVRRHCRSEERVQAVFDVAWRRRRDVVVVGGTALPWLLDLADDFRRAHRREVRFRRVRLAVGGLALGALCGGAGALTAAAGLAVHLSR